MRLREAFQSTGSVMTTEYDVDKLNRYYASRNQRGLDVPEDGDILNSEVQYMSISQLQDFVEEFGFSSCMEEHELRALAVGICEGTSDGVDPAWDNAMALIEEAKNER